MDTYLFGMMRPWPEDRDLVDPPICLAIGIVIMHVSNELKKKKKEDPPTGLGTRG